MAEMVWLGLGSNQGDRLEHLRSAVRRIHDHPALALVACSSVYETDYVGPGNQEAYLNAAVSISCELGPGSLLQEVKRWEEERGRRINGHMRPRPLDVDILFYGDHVLSEKNLVVPHLRLRERLFVLSPLSEISPEKKMPNSGETMKELCAKIRRKERSGVRLFAESTPRLLCSGDHLDKEFHPTRLMED